MTIGVGIIGLGMATNPHMTSLRELEAAGRAPSPERRRAFAEKWKVPVFDTQDELLTRPDLDLILILTTPGTHLRVAEAVAKAGKHIIVEKPVEVTVSRGEALAKAVEAADVRCSVCLQHRFRPASLRLKSILDAGELGPIISASGSIRWWRDDAYFKSAGRGTKARDGGGVLLTQAIHTLDLLLHLVGPHQDVAGFATTSPLRAIDTEDIAAAAIRFKNGAIGAIDATTIARPSYPERIELAGTKGSVRFTPESRYVQRTS
jgi:UDP-N-acetyl-2-amino-2-deoxyglucuronate dehydrogenase